MKKQEERKETEMKLKDVNTKMQKSNLVTDDRRLARLVKPVSGLIVNKVDIATLKNEMKIN